LSGGLLTLAARGGRCVWLGRLQQDLNNETTTAGSDGLLAQWRWHDGWYDTGGTGGDFVRPDAQFRDRVTADGSSGLRA
jgi:hypothetical protein